MKSHNFTVLLALILSLSALLTSAAPLPEPEAGAEGFSGRSQALNKRIRFKLPGFGGKGRTGSETAAKPAAAGTPHQPGEPALGAPANPAAPSKGKGRFGQGMLAGAAVGGLGMMMMNNQNSGSAAPANTGATATGPAGTTTAGTGDGSTTSTNGYSSGGGGSTSTNGSTTTGSTTTSSTGSGGSAPPAQ